MPKLICRGRKARVIWSNEFHHVTHSPPTWDILPDFPSDVTAILSPFAMLKVICIHHSDVYCTCTTFSSPSVAIIPQLSTISLSLLRTFVLLLTDGQVQTYLNLGKYLYVPACAKIKYMFVWVGNNLTGSSFEGNERKSSHPHKPQTWNNVRVIILWEKDLTLPSGEDL